MSRFSCLFLISVIVLFALGLVMIFNTSSAEVLDRFLDKSTHHALIKQMLYSLVGGVGAMGIWFIGYQNLLKLSGPLLVLGTLLLISVFVPGIGQQINGAHRWINLFGNSLQPSEFVKFLIPLYYIHCVTRAQGPLDLKSLLKLLGKLTVPLGLILIEPDNGTVFIVLVTILMLFILTRMRTLYWAVPLCILCVGGGIVSLRMPHVSDRIHIYLHPESDLKGKGHQPYQAKIATGSGGLFGKGLGESLQKLEYLPEARSDYIAAIFAEECGFVGMCGLICLYLLIAYAGFSIAQRASSIEGFYTAATVTFLICFQAFLNLGVVSGLLPSKGTNLPFFSQGGSSLLANLFACALILNIAKPSHILKTQGKTYGD